MKHFCGNQCACASAMTMAEASSSCGRFLVMLLDAMILASIFVVLVSVRLCLVVAILGIIMALVVNGSRPAQEAPQPDIA